MPFIFIDQGSPSIRHYSTPKAHGTSPINPSNATRTVETQSKTGRNPNPYQQTPSNKQTIRKIHQAFEIMSTPVFSITIEQLSIKNAWNLLQKHQIKHLPVTKNGTLNAIVSEGDILKALAFPDKNLSWVTEKVYAATESTDIHQLAHVMFDEHIGCLPIVNEQHEIQGMVTRSDILKITSQYGPMEFWA